MYRIAVTNRLLCQGDFLTRVEQLAKGEKYQTILLREKDLTEPEYEKLAEKKAISFLDAAKIVSCCDADQQHMDVAGHRKFADAIYEKLIQII